MMHSKKIETKFFYLFLLIIILLQIVSIFFNEMTLGGADNVSHFHIAKYAFKYPHLFLEHWGKPVYTALSAPFALFGFKMAQFFNVIIAILTLLTLYKISNSIYPSGAIYVIVLTAFAPIYFLLMTTCLTEILFSFVLVVAVYLFIKNRFIFSAIVLSFIPFVRNEGVILFPIFALALFLKRSYLSILFLSFGTIFYSVVGYFVFDDLFWIINRFPHSTGYNIYGSGELLHFVKKSNYIFGIPLIVFILFGFVFWGYEIFKKKQLRSESLILFIIVVGSWTAYFAAHSFVWWRGISSLGLIRVIGGVVPLAALTALKGIQFIFEKIRNRKVAIGILVFLSVAQVFLFFSKNHFPTKADVVDTLILKSSNYLKQNPQSGRVFYFNPEFVFHLGIDPYDNTKSSWGVGDKMQPSNSMEFGDILIWDAHFGPNEGGVSFDAVENDKNLQQIKTFLPIENIKVLGGYDYKIRIYKKEKAGVGVSSKNEFKRNLEIAEGKSKQIILLGNESVIEIKKTEEYSPTILIYANELKKEDLFEANLGVEFKSDEIIADTDVLLIISVENGKDKLCYESLSIVWGDTDKEWKTASVKTRFKADIPETAIIKMYVWNRGNKHIFIKKFDSEIMSY